MLTYLQYLAEQELSPVAWLKTNTSPTTAPGSTSFLLPDCTRLHTSQTHDRAAGYQLNACLDAGVIRVVPNSGIELHTIPNDRQAHTLEADFFNHDMEVDLTANGLYYGKTLKAGWHADDLRQWVRRTMQ